MTHMRDQAVVVQTTRKKLFKNVSRIMIKKYEPLSNKIGKRQHNNDFEEDIE